MTTWSPPRLKPLLEAGLSLFYPNVCQICEQNPAKPSEGYVCSRCWNHVRFVMPPYCARCGDPVPGAVTGEFVCAQCREAEPHFESARSAVVANGFLLNIIHRYKYGRALCFEPFLAGLLVRRAVPALAGQTWDWIVPVPLHPVKQREREFNQAERLARHLGRATGIPINDRLIHRIAPTRSQTTLSRQERAENVRNAFALHDKTEVKGKKIVVVDDVLTTCATTGECARILRRAGAASVHVWTVARG